jgi:hypothetical protein
MLGYARKKRRKIFLCIGRANPTYGSGDRVKMQLQQGPYSEAYARNTFLVKTLCDFVGAFQSFAQPNFFARGESREYEKPWLPGIWRKDHSYQDRTLAKPNEGSYTIGELSALKRCQDDFNLGVIDDRYFRRFVNNSTKDIDLNSEQLILWSALAQHYDIKRIYPSRLLDVTSDALVALYFAVRGEPDDDGFVLWSPLGNVSNDISHRPSTRTSGTYLDILSIGAKDGGTDYKPRDETLNYMRPPYPNLRTEAQRGGFIWNRTIGASYLPPGIVLRIPAAVKPTLRHALRSLNYTDERMFPVEQGDTSKYFE